MIPALHELPMRRGDLPCADLIDLYMAHYAGRDPSRVLVCQIGALADSSAVALGNVSMHGGFEEWLLSPVGLSAYEAVRGSA